MATVTDALLAGKMTKRVQSKITEGLAVSINEVAEELAAGGDASMLRSRAIRELLVAGVKARRSRQRRG